MFNDYTDEQLEKFYFAIEHFSSTEKYNAIAYAVDASENPDGYVNKFIFKRSLIVACGILIMPEKMIFEDGDDVLKVYDRMMVDDDFAMMAAAVAHCDFYSEAESEFMRQLEYRRSISYAMSVFMDFMNKKFDGGVKNLVDKMSLEEVKEVQDIAANWGFAEA